MLFNFFSVIAWMIFVISSAALLIMMINQVTMSTFERRYSKGWKWGRYLIAMLISLAWLLTINWV